MSKKMLCDGCGKIKKVKSYDGRTLVCKTCQIEHLDERLEALEKKVRGIQEVNQLWDGS